MSEDMAKPDYEQLCKEYEHKIEELNEQNEELRRSIKVKEYCIEHLSKENTRLEGRIGGLEFSIRCNGVSGREVII